MTNWHQPDSTLLLLVASFIGGSPTKLRELYAGAVDEGYRFLSYGDSSLLIRDGRPGAGIEAAGAGGLHASAGAGGAPGPFPGDRVLLHSCCAPCSGAMIEEMVEDGLDVTVFFYNPNIHPKREYDLRKEENKRFAAALGVPFVDADYDTDQFFARTKGLEFAPERGPRCTVCFDMRMERTADYAAAHGFQYITTTNATSRWKDPVQVDGAGVRAAARHEGVAYLARDWQTEAMTARKYRINADQSFYKQEYCGCSFSLRDSNTYRAQHGLDPVVVGNEASVYADPAVDAAEESREVVDAFFRASADYEQQLRDTYDRRRKDKDGGADRNNW